MSRDFNVNPAVLIPRPETEELVAMILKEHAEHGGNDTGLFNVLDIGTGSGCIITTLASERPKWTCYGVDISDEALAVARLNAEYFGANVQLLNMDLFEMANGGETSRGETSNGGDFPDTFDLIVSNPPYIHPNEATTMDPQVLKYEPEVALFASKPLDVYEAIFVYTVKALSKNGQLFLELNAQLADQISAVGHRYFPLIELRKDDGGKARFLVAKKDQ
jgi:release factor glutamine methyltransferase